MMVTINDVGVSFVCLFNVCLLNKVHNLTTLYQFSNFYYHSYAHWFIVTDVPSLALLVRPVCPICLLHSEGLPPATFFRELPGFLGPLHSEGGMYVPLFQSFSLIRSQSLPPHVHSPSHSASPQPRRDGAVA